MIRRGLVNFRSSSQNGSSRAALAGGLLALLLVTFCFYCSDDGGPTEPPPPPEDDPEISYTAAAPSPGDNTVSLQLRATEGNRLDLDVTITEIGNAYAMAFDLVYNPDVLNWSGYEEGDHFNQDGSATSVQVAENPEGRIIVGISRLGDVGGVSGTGAAMTLIFNGVSNGGSSFSFENAQVVDPTLTVIPDVDWFGGSATVSGL